MSLLSTNSDAIKRKIFPYIAIFDFIGFFFLFDSLFASFSALQNTENTLNGVMTMAYILVILSLPLSGFLHLKKSKWAPQIYFGQLPFRALFLIFTLGFLSSLGTLFQSRALYLILLGGAAIMEVFRFSLTVRVFKSNR